MLLSVSWEVGGRPLASQPELFMAVFILPRWTGSLALVLLGHLHEPFLAEFVVSFLLRKKGIFLHLVVNLEGVEGAITSGMELRIDTVGGRRFGALKASLIQSL